MARDLERELGDPFVISMKVNEGPGRSDEPTVGTMRVKPCSSHSEGPVTMGRLSLCHEPRA